MSWHRNNQLLDALEPAHGDWFMLTAELQASMYKYIMGRMTPDHDDSNAAQMWEHKEIVEPSMTHEAGLHERRRVVCSNPIWAVQQFYEPAA